MLVKNHFSAAVDAKLMALCTFPLVFAEQRGRGAAAGGPDESSERALHGKRNRWRPVGVFFKNGKSAATQREDEASDLAPVGCRLGTVSAAAWPRCS